MAMTATQVRSRKAATPIKVSGKTSVVVFSAGFLRFYGLAPDNTYHYAWSDTTLVFVVSVLSFLPRLTDRANASN